MIFLVLLNDPYKLVFHEANKTKQCVSLCFRCLRNRLMPQEDLTGKNKQSATWENKALQDNTL